jgi:hypothetical protein
VKLLLICGPWGSGTSAVAGVLDRLGAVGLGPYFQVNDRRVENSYESLSFREFMQNLIGRRMSPARSGLDAEANLARFFPSPEQNADIEHELREYRNRLENEEIGLGATTAQPLFLKYPLACLVIPQICKIFDTRLIYVVRPIRDIEATRKRRRWHPHTGAPGAEVIYSRMFTTFVNEAYPTTIVRYARIVAAPFECAQELAVFSGLGCTSAQIEDAARSFTRNDR